MSSSKPDSKLLFIVLLSLLLLTMGIIYFSYNEVKMNMVFRSNKPNQIIMQGDLNKIKSVINFNNVNYQDKRKMTALHYGVLSKNVKMVAWMLSIGGNFKLKDKFSNTPFDYSLISGNIDMVLAFKKYFSNQDFKTAIKNKLSKVKSAQLRQELKEHLK